MGESNWTNRLMIGLRPGARDAAAVQIGARFDKAEAATRDLETRLAALEDAVAQIASGCKWPECERGAPSVEPFTCGPGHAALRPDDAALRFAGLPVAAAVKNVGHVDIGSDWLVGADDNKEADAPPTCEPGACELAMLTRQQDALSGACDELRAERDALAEESDDLRVTVERVRRWARYLHLNSIWQREVRAALDVLSLLGDTDTPKQED